MWFLVDFIKSFEVLDPILQNSVDKKWYVTGLRVKGN